MSRAKKQLMSQVLLPVSACDADGTNAASSVLVTGCAGPATASPGGLVQQGGAESGPRWPLLLHYRRGRLGLGWSAPNLRWGRSGLMPNGKQFKLKIFAVLRTTIS